jgi:hypothetical protein
VAIHGHGVGVHAVVHVGVGGVVVVIVVVHFGRRILGRRVVRSVESNPVLKTKERLEYILWDENVGRVDG